MSKRVTVGDLRSGDNGGGKPFLYCTECCSRYSADAGDYWNAPATTVLKCCRRNMLRVVEHCSMEEV